MKISNVILGTEMLDEEDKPTSCRERSTLQVISLKEHRTKITVIGQSKPNDEIDFSHISGTKCSDIVVGSKISDETRRLKIKVASPNTVCAIETALHELCEFYVSHNNIFSLKGSTEEKSNYRLQTQALFPALLYLFRDKEEFEFL